MARSTRLLGACPLARFRLILGVLAFAAVPGCDSEQEPTAVQGTPPSAAEIDENLVTTLANDGTGSLRDRVFFASTGATIHFAPELDGQTIVVSSPIVLDRNVTIDGPATEGITISGGGSAQVFEARSGTVALRNLTITGSDAGDPSSGHGTAIYVTGSTLRVEKSTLSGNGGDGFFVVDGSLSVENSTISGNAGSGLVQSGGSSHTLRHVTIAYNTGRGLDRGGTVFVIENSLFANNGRDCSSAPGAPANTLSGVNLDSDDSCGLDDQFDLPATDPGLAPLADNGGPTRTHALPFGSPAVDADTPPCAIATDQRGVSRPQGAGCDIGAYERQPVSVQLTVNAAGTVNPNTGAATVGGTMSCSLPLAVELEVNLSQIQMVRRVPVVKESTTDLTVACSGSANWTVTVPPATGGTFLNGQAQATARAVNSDNAGAATRQIRLSWGKKK